MEHKLKILPEYFEAVMSGAKTFEIRKNDRNYQVGDRLFLNEFDGEKYTSRYTERIINYITDYAQQDGYVVMSIGKNFGD